MSKANAAQLLAHILPSQRQLISDSRPRVIVMELQHQQQEHADRRASSSVPHSSSFLPTSQDEGVGKSATFGFEHLANGGAPLCEAVAKNDVPRIRELLSRGVDPSAIMTARPLCT